MEVKWNKCTLGQPKIGCEFLVVWVLDDNKYPVVTSMDWDAIKKEWSDPRGTNTKINEQVIYWMEYPEPPKDIPKVIWSDEPINDKAVYGHCMHGENMANCEICNSYK